MRTPAAVAALLFAALLPPCAAAQAPRVLAIEIKPVSGGSSDPNHTITIRYQEGHYSRRWNPEALSSENNSFRLIAEGMDMPPALPPLFLDEPAGPDLPVATAVTPRAAVIKPREFQLDTVPERDVQALLAALTAPTIPSPSLPNLGVTPQWLAAHADEAARMAGALGEQATPGQRALFYRSLADLQLVGRLMPSLLASTWTDDGVWMRLRVTLSNGRTVTADTNSLTPYVLPWSFPGAHRRPTFNAGISRALARLLPPDVVNDYRISGQGLLFQLTSSVMDSIRPRWQAIGAEDHAGAALSRLRQLYTIRRSEVSSNIGLHFGPMNSSSAQLTLQADLSRPQFPSNLRVATAFRLQDGQAEGLDSFLATGRRYEQLLLSTPWVMESIRRHPKRGAWLAYADGASISAKALAIFTADMHLLGRDDLAAAAAAQRLELVNLSYHGNELILFPDHHAIVWRWAPDLHLFDWPIDRHKAQRCSDYDSLYAQCVAAVIDPQGRLVP